MVLTLTAAPGSPGPPFMKAGAGRLPRPAFHERRGGQAPGRRGRRSKVEGRSKLLAFHLPPSTCSGLTFVELLIAATIFSVLVTGLTSHLRGGGIVWRRTTETVEALQRQRAALDQLARDLGNAVIYDDRPEAYGAEVGMLPPQQFAPDGMDWFTVSLSLSRSAAPSVRFVTYRCEELDGVWGLRRTSQSVGEARARQAAPTPELLLEGCRELSLRYAYTPVEDGQPLEWRPQWPGGSGETLQLPRLMEVTSRMESGQALQRVAAVPVGVLGTVE